uniref:Death inducer-obliterator 1 n=1 Tax=Maylandia zebra TaxID=106582 RepID=A0A3P9BS69_9CICH
MAADPETRCPVRRSGRQPKRTDKLEEFLLNAKRASRKSAPPSVESGDPPSQTPTDAETASEASFDGNADSKAVEEKAETPERRTRSGARKQTQKKGRGSGRQTRGGGATVKDEGSSENEEDSKDAVKNTQDDSEEKKEEKSDLTSEAVGSVSAAQAQPEEDSEKKEFAEEKNDDKNDELEKTGEDEADKAATQEEEEEGEEEEEEEEEEDDEDDEDENDLSTSSSSVESDDGGYDPNALYCICRQKHNKRFMICCDRCEEWFHGDCVGITEARGRLMERNGEDYICPNCTAKKNQVVRPATSILSTNMEIGKPKTDFASPTNKATEDLGIKGRIEKATNPTGKKKIKIFQPRKADEESSLSRCIGPGCENDAQPDSVYCGNDCILRHAAAAMKSITDVKEPKQKDKAKAQKKSTLKKVQKKTQEESDSEDHSPDPDDDDDEDEHAEEHPPPPATASWSSDHNYIAVTPEKTTPISPTVLNKKCMYLFEGLDLLLKPYCCSSIINVLLSC